MIWPGLADALGAAGDGCAGPVLGASGTPGGADGMAGDVVTGRRSADPGITGEAGRTADGIGGTRGLPPPSGGRSGAIAGRCGVFASSGGAAGAGGGGAGAALISGAGLGGGGGVGVSTTGGSCAATRAGGCSVSIGAISSSSSSTAIRDPESGTGPSKPKWRRTAAATSSSSELECVFLSCTPNSGNKSRIRLGFTSSSRASSLIRILLMDKSDIVAA